MLWGTNRQFPNIKNVELKTLLFLLLFIFLVNTPISYIKSNALSDIQIKVEKSEQLFSSNLNILQSYLNLAQTPLALNYAQDPEAFNTLASALMSGQTYLKSAVIQPVEQMSNLGMFVELIEGHNDHASLHRLTQPIYDDQTVVGELQLEIESHMFVSYLYDGMFIMSDTGFVHWSQYHDIISNAYLSDDYSEVLSQIHRINRRNGVIDLGRQTVVFQVTSDLLGEKTYLVHLVTNAEIVPTHIYVTFVLAVLLMVLTNVFIGTKRKKKALEQISYIDELSTLNNRHYLNHIESSLLKRDHYFIAIIDIDHFKRVNDSFGHAIGDKVIREVANTIKSSIRAHDYAFRLGGEEFAVVIKTKDIAVACNVVERVRISVEQQSNNPKVTISAGIAPVIRNIKDSLGVADQFLYVAKRSGRNQVRSVPKCC